MVFLWFSSILLPFSVGNPRVSAIATAVFYGAQAAVAAATAQVAAVETPVGWGKNGEIHWKVGMKTMKNHEKPWKTMKNNEKPWKNHEKPWKPWW